MALARVLKIRLKPGNLLPLPELPGQLSQPCGSPTEWMVEAWGHLPEHRDEIWRSGAALAPDATGPACFALICPTCFFEWRQGHGAYSRFKIAWQAASRHTFLLVWLSRQVVGYLRHDRLPLDPELPPIQAAWTARGPHKIRPGWE